MTQSFMTVHSSGGPRQIPRVARYRWFVLDMDAGVLGVFRTKREAIAGFALGQIRVRRCSPGSYEVQWHYDGSPGDGDGFFLERLETEEDASRGGWEWAYTAWLAAGKPEGRLDSPVPGEDQ